MKNISLIAMVSVFSAGCAFGNPAPSDKDVNDDVNDDAMAALSALVTGEHRTIDGVGNNVDSPSWGSTSTALLRKARVDYSDGLSSPAGADRLSARQVSNDMAAQSGSLPNDIGASDYLWAWGQFVDHDINITEGANPAEAFNIAVPTGDPFFDPNRTGTQVIPLSRSNYLVDANGIRQQVNHITAYIDASNVYGSDSVRAAALRTLDGSGRLKTGAGDLLPKNIEGLPNAQPPGVDPAVFFLAGDIRANEITSLTSLHTLFVREHNRWVTLIASIVPELDGDDLYQLGRRLVGAEIQAITVREFLPILLGNGLGTYPGYDTATNASIANEFSTGAYRIGHTMLSSTILRLGADGSEVDAGHLPLKAAFFTPSIIEQEGIDSVLRGLAAQRCESIDTLLVDGVRNFLFGPPGAGGFDLASLNIQRGRDHGLANYNDTRRDYGLTPVSSFAQISSNSAVQAKLANTYGSVENIDLWIGGLAEDPLPGAMVGELFSRIIRDQFTRLRNGDRFWYESLPGPVVSLVNSMTLAKIIRLNTGIGDELADDVFTGPPGPVGEGHLVINEILADPSPFIDANGDGVISSTNDEFIEFVNVGDGTLDLSGAVYSDGFGARLTFADGVVVAPGQSLILFGGGNPQGSNLSGSVVVVGSGSLSLNNSGDTVTLTRSTGEVLATTSFGPAKDQSVTRAVELDDGSEWVGHLSINAARRASPGTRADGITPL